MDWNPSNRSQTNQVRHEYALDRRPNLYLRNSSGLRFYQLAFTYENACGVIKARLIQILPPHKLRPGECVWREISLLLGYYDKLPISRGVCNQQVVGSNPTAGSVFARCDIERK
jgi:hypothetical protein